ncbi:hypothetical protein ACSBR2_038186 [Camellia fascicularis]
MHVSSLCFELTHIFTMETTTSNKHKPHIAIFPSPGMGHLIPLAEFAKQLVFSHHFSVTFIVPDFGFPIKSQKSFLDSLPAPITVVYLPPPVISNDLSGSVNPGTLVTTGMTRCVPGLRDSLKALTESTRLVALVVDAVGTDAFDLTEELGILRYVFAPFCAMSLSLFFHLSKLDETGIKDYKDLPDPVEIPGCIPIRLTALPGVIQDLNSEFYKLFLYHTKRYYLADGIIINSFIDLEPGAFKVLMEDGSGKPPFYPIGPLLQTGPTTDDGTLCLTWLDEQPRSSVLFVSFGSSGTISQEQLTELALGLEMSEQKFIWVVRIPAKNAANGVYYNAQSNKEEDPFDFLPNGFMERTRARGLGLLVKSWAPQVQILSHGSTGGFISHCGWNSTIESLTHGVPLIAWPLYAEQEMITVMLTQDLKVALTPKKNENGMVGREEIAKCVRDLIVGEEGKLLRKKTTELKDAAAMATSEHGSSTKSLAQLIQIFENHNVLPLKK